MSNSFIHQALSRQKAFLACRSMAKYERVFAKAYLLIYYFRSSKGWRSGRLSDKRARAKEQIIKRVKQGRHHEDKISGCGGGL
jgi:hypothetical protein